MSASFGAGDPGPGNREDGLAVRLTPQTDSKLNTSLTEQSIVFPPFHLDPRNACLWHGKRRITLTPKDFAVLRYLATHPEQLVRHQELLKAVWPDTVVSAGVLKVCLRRIRQALRDSATTPRLIETVHRQGYRFIAPLGTALLVQKAKDKRQKPHPPAHPSTSPFSLVDREVELAQLQECLEKARTGERQMVFITGEVGIGKTTLVDTFLAGLGTSPLSSQTPSLKPQVPTLIGRGQCVEHYGAGEAYLPWLEALSELCRRPQSERFIKLMRRYAPTWLVQLPWLLGTAEREKLRSTMTGATQERMLRELAEALEALTGRGAQRTTPLLILVLEDLHWSDYATLDLLSSLARRREAARMLLIGTYRPVEVIMREHPLKSVKQELVTRNGGVELALELLSEKAVGEYLRIKVGMNGEKELDLRHLAHSIHQRTEGNPLFMVNVVDYVLVRNAARDLAEAVATVQTSVPQNLQQLVEQQFDRLSPEERRMLEAASVAGVEFSTAAVAAALEKTPERVEEQCERLAQRNHFLRSIGTSEWPDETVAECYGFLHMLYQDVVYGRIAVGRRRRLHQRIGERQEAAYGERASEIAAELAMHFARGRDYSRAVQYHEAAAQAALQRYAYQEAIQHLKDGLDLLQKFPDTAERTQRELELQTTLCAQLIIAEGYGAREIQITCARIQELAGQTANPLYLFPALLGLCGFHLVRAELQVAYEFGQQALSIAQSVQDRLLLLLSSFAVGPLLFWRGEFTAAKAHLEQVIQLYDPQQDRFLVSMIGLDPRTVALSYLAIILWFLGYPDQARRRSQEACALAHEVSHSHSLAVALYFAAWLSEFCHDDQEVHAYLERHMTLAIERGFLYWRAAGATLQGWMLIGQGQSEHALMQINDGIAAYRAAGAEVGSSYWLGLLARTHKERGHGQDGLASLTEALHRAERSGEHFYHAELNRLTGDLTIAVPVSLQDRQSTTKKSVK